MIHRLTPLVLVAGALVLAGCRTYGDQRYETGPKTYRAVQQTVQQMEQGLGRAELNLRRLQSAAESADTLDGLVDRYRELVESHETTLANYRTQAERLTTESAYRTLHRTYGAMVTDWRLLQRQYERTTRKVWATVRNTTVSRAPTRLESSYSITPLQYPGSERAEMSMAEALRELDGTPGLQREEQSGGTE